MNKQLHDAFQATLETLRVANLEIFPDGFGERVETHVAAVDALYSDVCAEYDEMEGDLKEDDERAVERLEALESAKDELAALSEKLEEIQSNIASFIDKFSDIRDSISNAKG